MSDIEELEKRFHAALAALKTRLSYSDDIKEIKEQAEADRRELDSIRAALAEISNKNSGK